MAANFGLLNSAAQVPMSGQPMSMHTPVENQTLRLNMEGKQIGNDTAQLDNAQEHQTFDRANADRDFLTKALAQPGVDLATPDGMKNLLEQSKGNVSSDAYMKLTDHANTMTQTLMNNQKTLQSMHEQQLKDYNAQMEQLVPQLQSLDEQHTKTTEEKGQVAADQELREGMAKVALANQDKKLPDGSPLFSPVVFQNLKDGPIDVIHGVIAGSQYVARQTQQALETSRAENLDANAKLLNDGGKMWTTLQDPKDGSLYKVSRQPNGGILHQGPDGQFVQVTALPQGLVGIDKLGPQANKRPTDVWLDGDGNKWSVLNNKEVMKNGLDVMPIAAMPSTVKKMGQKGAGEKPDEGVLPETANFFADYTTRTGRAFPIPALGIGNTIARTAYMNAVAKLAADRGYDGNEAGALAIGRDASKLALANTTKQDAIIKVGEKDLEGVMAKMKDELQKIGGPDSPKIRAMWNHVSTDWLGNPEFKGFNAAYANFLDVAAKVLSGQTGAGGTPVSYLEVAKKQLGDNPNLKQLAEVDKTMKDLFSIRRKAVEDEKKSLTGASEMTPKESSPAALRAAGQSSDTVVPPAKQAAADNDAVGIWKQEYDKEVSGLGAITDPAAKARSLENIRGLRRMLQAKGVTVPDAGAAAQDNPAPAFPKPSPSAIEHLKLHPELGAFFKKKYGYLPS